VTIGAPITFHDVYIGELSIGADPLDWAVANRERLSNVVGIGAKRRKRSALGDLNMADMAQGALLILACAFLYGLTGVSVSRSNQEQALIWSSALDFER
jgi:hypothetical protein